jgi:AcrR family transcriptional regulator/DNA-binding CsgD family transcriptional regulator
VEHPPTHAGPHQLHPLATVGALGVRLSGPAPRDIDGGLESLTDREREIAAVVAERRSNKEVGAALYIAPKTVEHNLGRIYAKLDLAPSTISAWFRSDPEHNGFARLRLVGLASDTSAPRARVGRPRDGQIDVAVLRATLAVLDESGYGGLTLEEVARRAGTTKPAIHRRWSSRQRLVLSALARRLGEARAPDTGCTLCDLDECLKVFVAAFRRLPPGVIGPLFADCAGDRELHDAFMVTLFEPPRAAVRETLERAQARGDLRAEVDIGLILDVIGSLVHYRVLFGHAPVSNAEVERAVEALLQGIATDYPRLLEHSRRMDGDPKLHHLHT